jgi:hypothetical protein
LAITININSVDKTSVIEIESLSISDELNSRNSCSFNVISATGSYVPTVGLDVEVLNGATTVFAGTIDYITETAILKSNTIRYNVDCVDYNQLADRFLVAESYDNQTLKQIVEDIVDNYLTTDGVTYTTNIETGPTLVKSVFNYMPASQAFDELSDISGLDWYIDYDKELHFFTKGAKTNSTDLDEDNIIMMTVKNNREQYRNRQYIRAGFDLTDSRTDSFKGDGELRAFLTNYPVGKVPTVEVDSVSKTVGIRGLDTGKDWYWSKGSNEITQDDAGTVLTSGNTLEVTYQGLFPIIATSDRIDAITDRQTVEGGSGIYEGIEDDQSIEDQDTAIDKANGYLRRFGNINEVINIITRTTGYFAGQLVQITEATHDIDGLYLIRRVNISDIIDGTLEYEVELLSGENVGGWVNFFKKLKRDGRKFVIRENEVLIKLLTILDTVTVTESLDVSDAAPETRIGFGEIGFMEVG